MPTHSTVETTLLVNSSNPTLVAVWDLGEPPKKVKETVLRLRGNLETLGPDGDRRERVPAADFAPNGKYRAICKLIMGYVDRPGAECIGTGWLISDDLLVTAGHCAYDPANGGHLQYMKIYVGYSGPESLNKPTCVYRRGAVVALPAEYLKAEAEVHDVSFVRLDRKLDAMDGLIPMKFEDTPLLERLTLGVVGYPGDRYNGEYMMEHWSDVEVDLNRTETLLQYKIDTTGGQSGSPVLRRNVGSSLTAIGVHIAGGWPNKASTIGPVGNIFEEYILAMMAKTGVIEKGIQIVALSTTKLPAPGFQMIRVESMASNRSKKPSSENIGITNGFVPSTNKPNSTSNEGKDVEKETMRALWGTNRRETTEIPKKNPTTPKLMTGELLSFPETLVLHETDGPPITTTDMIAAAKKAEVDGDMQSVFFINFPPDFASDPAKRGELKKAKDLVEIWQCWATSLSEGKLLEQIKGGSIPNDSSDESNLKRSSYRAKVFDFLMRKGTWFIKDFDQQMSRQITCEKYEFHTAILTAILQGFTVPSSVFSTLEKVLSTISDGIIKYTTEKSTETQQVWVMLTRYEYVPLLGVVQPIIRIINFGVTSSASKYMSNKHLVQKVDFKLSFQQTQTSFNSRIFEKISDQFDKELVDAGKALAGMKTTDIEIAAV